MLRHGLMQYHAAPHAQCRLISSRRLQLRTRASAAPLDKIATPSPNESSRSNGATIIPPVVSLPSSPNRPTVAIRHIGVQAQADRLDLDEVWVPFRWPGQFGGDAVYLSGANCLSYTCSAAVACSVQLQVLEQTTCSPHHHACISSSA